MFGEMGQGGQGGALQNCWREGHFFGDLLLLMR